MNTIKLITLSLTVWTALAALFLLIHLLLRPYRAKHRPGDKMNLCYGLWFACLFLSGASVLSALVTVSGEAIDVLIVKVTTGLAWQLVRTNGLLIGIGLAWFLCWFFVVKYLLRIILPESNDQVEMEENGIAYFVMRGAMFLSIMLSLSSLLISVLRLFLPGLDVPFYH